MIGTTVVNESSGGSRNPAFRLHPSFFLRLPYLGRPCAPCCNRRIPRVALHPPL